MLTFENFKFNQDPAVIMSPEDWDQFTLNGSLSDEQGALKLPNFTLAVEFQLGQYAQRLLASTMRQAAADNSAHAPLLLALKIIMMNMRFVYRTLKMNQIEDGVPEAPVVQLDGASALQHQRSLPLDDRAVVAREMGGGDSGAGGAKSSVEMTEVLMELGKMRAVMQHLHVDVAQEMQQGREYWRRMEERQRQEEERVQQVQRQEEEPAKQVLGMLHEHHELRRSWETMRQERRAEREEREREMLLRAQEQREREIEREERVREREERARERHLRVEEQAIFLKSQCPGTFFCVKPRWRVRFRICACTH